MNWLRRLCVPRPSHAANASNAPKAEQAHANDAQAEPLLYEKWMRRERWNLIAEGIPLLLGQDPQRDLGALSGELQARRRELESHAKHCAERRLLTVDSPEKPIGEWQVNPLDLYRWASVGRHPMPDALCRLAEFMAKAIKPELDAGQAQSLHERHIQTALRAALSLLSHAPEGFRRENGIDPLALSESIHQEADFWFGGEEPPLSAAAMHNLFRECLQQRPPDCPSGSS